ncbi:MAG TPA: hypothetical protein VNT75_19550 [Symbiobacteriaceae bacterium]|nr:hypothetical protein [Symbiobacteriaceae bacterium]
MMMMNGQTFSGSGFVCCMGAGTEGELYRLQDPMQFGSTIADLVTTDPTVIGVLRSVTDREIMTTVSGTVISAPNAVRPRVRVTQASAMGAPAPTTPAPTQMAPPPQQGQTWTQYFDCVARCIGEKVPGLAAEEVINNTCAGTLLAMGFTQAGAGALIVGSVELPAAVVALAVCVAATAGLSVGAVLECFIACWPGGRLMQGPIIMDEGGGSGGRPAQMPVTLQMQLGIAIARDFAARGVHMTPVQALQLLQRCPQAVDLRRIFRVR